jgi:hypothetical protein
MPDNKDINIDGVLYDTESKGLSHSNALEIIRVKVSDGVVNNYNNIIPKVTNIKIFKESDTSKNVDYFGLIYNPYKSCSTFTNYTATKAISASHELNVEKYKDYLIDNPINVTGSDCYYYNSREYQTEYLGNFAYNHNNFGDIRFSHINYTGYAYTNFSDDIAIVHDYERMTKRNEIRAQLHIWIKSRADEIRNISGNEKVAMRTLRDMISEADFRKYMKYGFISVKAKSGKIYQIFRNRLHTKVYLQGELVEEICVMMKGSNIPPTDKIIAFKTIIETDENAFKKMGNVYPMKKAA